MPRSIGVVTVARSDYGHLQPLLHEIRGAADLELRLLVSGAHLSARLGATAALIEKDGWAIADRVDTGLDDDTPEAIGRALGTAVREFTAALARRRPDVLVVLGDRWEMLAAALAALPLAVPVAHLHGGEVTEGVIDEQIRHALTKLSHLHFAATEPYARRIRQMGEEPWRVHVTGAPGLDRFRTMTYLSRDELRARLGVPLTAPTLLVTYHPVTLALDRTEAELAALLAALEAVDAELIVTYPGADAASGRVIDALRAFAARRPHVHLATSLGDEVYASLLRVVDAMAGNSSSGVIEAASFALPAVNVGDRQRGRLRPPNVIDVGSSRDEMLAGIRRALDPSFRGGLGGLRNPYGDGYAAPRIAQALRTVELGPALVVKRFVDADDGAS